MNFVKFIAYISLYHSCFYLILSSWKFATVLKPSIHFCVRKHELCEQMPRKYLIFTTLYHYFNTAYYVHVYFIS